MLPIALIIAGILALMFIPKNWETIELRISICFFTIVGVCFIGYEMMQYAPMIKSMYSIGTHVELVEQSHLGLRFDPSETSYFYTK